MEASVDAPRRLEGDKARRIIAAMRASVSTRGAAGSTFDHVAREAGVSRGLYYYFCTKERLLAEVVRRDCNLRMERLSATAAGAGSADALLGALGGSLARQNRESAAEQHRRVRRHLAGILTLAREQGAVRLDEEPEVVSEVLFSLADGLAMRMLAEPERDFGATVAAATRAARVLVRSA
jgi:AcrR family transcriptional regulator